MSGLLLHTCCAPCLSGAFPALEREGWKLTAFFHNPNIHPYSERSKRLEALKGYAPRLGLDLLVDEEYPLEENLSMLLASPDRCRACFEERLRAAARKAALLDIGVFSTTLAISPWQDQELLRLTGTRIACEEGVDFAYRDLRPFYRQSIETSRREGLYRQKYCGCIMSERDSHLRAGKGKGTACEVRGAGPA
jgi:epoxyqueuosine reductase